nr:MAG TPA: nucelotide kinase [Caudoviricetes sp.]
MNDSAFEEKVNHPSHYNTVKYISRAGKKDPKKFREDLEKAIWYLNRELKKSK